MADAMDKVVTLSMAFSFLSFISANDIILIKKGDTRFGGRSYGRWESADDSSVYISAARSVGGDSDSGASGSFFTLLYLQKEEIGEGTGWKGGRKGRSI